MTGKFLGVKVVEGAAKGKEREEKHSVTLLDSGEASKESSAFCFTNSALKVCVYVCVCVCVCV